MFEISLEEFLSIGNPQIIDIRDNFSYTKNHINGAKNIIYNELDQYYYKYLNKNETYYIYCEMGKKSIILSYKLNSLGYNVYSIRGGYINYLNKVY